MSTESNMNIVFEYFGVFPMLCTKCNKMCFQTGVTKSPLPKWIFFPTVTDILNLPWFQIHQDAGIGFFPPSLPCFHFISYSVASSLFSFFMLCVPLHASFFFGWQKWIMKNKHLTDLVWILHLCVVIIRGWDWGVMRDWGKTSLPHIKYTLVPLISHTLSEVNQPVLVGQTNFLWLKGK